MWVLTEVHVQLRLLIGDVSAGHGGDLFWGVESPAIPARLTELQAGPQGETVPTPGPAYGRATPNLRPTSASSILIDAQSILFVATHTSIAQRVCRPGVPRSGLKRLGLALTQRFRGQLSLPVPTLPRRLTPS